MTKHEVIEAARKHANSVWNTECAPKLNIAQRLALRQQTVMMLFKAFVAGHALGSGGK